MSSTNVSENSWRLHHHLNEARNIGACLDRLVEFDEVILVDSGSTDGTVELTGQYENVQASYHAWNGFSEQKAHTEPLSQ